MWIVISRRIQERPPKPSCEDKQCARRWTLNCADYVGCEKLLRHGQCMIWWMEGVVDQTRWKRRSLYILIDGKRTMENSSIYCPVGNTMLSRNVEKMAPFLLKWQLLALDQISSVVSHGHPLLSELPFVLLVDTPWFVCSGNEMAISL